jgi:hypothetical protein
MGSAYTALASDAYAALWNPAGLGFVRSAQMAAEYMSYVQSINYENASVAYPLRPSRALGASIQYLGSGDIQATQVGGASAGTFSSYYAAYGLSYGQSITDQLSLGLTGKIVQANISDVTATAFAADLGSFYRYRHDLTLAATLTNLGTKLNFLNEGDSLPLAFHLGAAYQPAAQWLGTAEMVYASDGGPAGRLGAQWRPMESLSLRLGYRTDTLTQLSALAGFSTGFGLNFRMLELAYAWAPMSDLGDVHHITLIIKFGPETTTNLSKVKEPPPPEKAPDNMIIYRPAPSLERGAPEGPMNSR